MPSTQTKQVSQRLYALDVLRGATVCFMIIVNTPGSGATPFWPLLHADWHGFTPTDLVFPCFLFVVGNAMALSMGKLQPLPPRAFASRVLRRTLIIFLLGFLMYWFPFFQHMPDGSWSFKPMAETRIMGVLQRIALCYGAAAFLIRFLPEKTVKIIAVLFLLLYWLLLYIGGDYTLQGNAALKLDLLIFGDRHLYHGEGIAFDPEGLLSTLPAIVQVLVGYYAGQFLRRNGQGYQTIASFLLAALAMIVVAYFWHSVFPINKKLWTSPFVLYTSGLSLAILGALIYRVEIAGPGRAARFFEVFGKNPLFIYLLSEILAILLWTIPVGGGSLYEMINTTVFQSLAPGPWGSLLFALTIMFTCWLVAWWLDQKHIYIRV